MAWRWQFDPFVGWFKLIHNNKKCAVFLCTVLLLPWLLLLTSCQMEAKISVDPLFYKVSDDDSSVYILGSIHIGRTSIYPLPPDIMSVYEKCETAMFEVDLNTLPDQNDDFSIEETIALAGAETVERAVAAIKEEYPNMRRRAQKLYPSVNMENITQAGYQTLQGLLSLAASTRSQLTAECGIDQMFISYALRDKKNIIGVESWEEQYALTYNLPPEAYKAALNEYIAVEEMAKRFHDEFDMWCEGDAAGIEQMEVSPLRQANEDSWQHIQYENFLIRNKHMADKVTQQLERDETTFALLGVAHIVGEDGVITLLKEMGYTVDLVSLAQ